MRYAQPHSQPHFQPHAKTRRLTLAAAALLCAAVAPPSPAQTRTLTRTQPHPAKALAPCTLATPAEITAVAATQVQPGQPGENDCTWRDGKGNTVVYLSLKDSTGFHDFRAQMQSTGKMVPITGVGEDAFFVSSAGSSAALYTLKKRHVVLLTIDGPGYSKAQNEAAEQALANRILARL
jgi:hypothetical protein